MLLKKGQAMFEDATAGVHPAVISQFEDAGVAETPWGPKPQVRVIFFLAETDSAGRQKRFATRFTNSLNVRSNLGKFIMALFGLADTPEEFDAATLIGKQCLLTFGTVTVAGVQKIRFYSAGPGAPGQNVLIPRASAAVVQAAKGKAVPDTEGVRA